MHLEAKQTIVHVEELEQVSVPESPFLSLNQNWTTLEHLTFASLPS